MIIVYHYTFIAYTLMTRYNLIDEKKEKISMKYSFPKLQGIQANEDNSTYYVVQKDVETDDPNERVPVKVNTEFGNPYFSDEKASYLADLRDQYGSWMSN